LLYSNSPSLSLHNQLPENALLMPHVLDRDSLFHSFASLPPTFSPESSGFQPLEGPNGWYSSIEESGSLSLRCRHTLPLRVGEVEARRAEYGPYTLVTTVFVLYMKRQLVERIISSINDNESGTGWNHLPRSTHHLISCKSPLGRSRLLPCRILSTRPKSTSGRLRDVDTA
jgi:hypothetical protein